MTTNDDIRRRARAVAGETSHEQRRERLQETVKPSANYVLPPGGGTSFWVSTRWERFVNKVKGLFK